MERHAWRMDEPQQPLTRVEDAIPEPDADETVVAVAGCGICHTDLGFLDGHVATRKEPPLVLGHEIAGTVVAAGADATAWNGKQVVVAAVIPCGECDLCGTGRGNACSRQVMPGNDRDGGFASHVIVPAAGLAEVSELPTGYELADLAVVADAVTTPLQAVRRAGVDEGDLVAVVGTGGVGTYAVQVAAASGARVIAIDIDPARLEPLTAHGAAAVVDASGLSPREVRDRVREHASSLGAPRIGWKIFECSGTAAGQETAFGLVGPTATLAIVGFTRAKVHLRLSNLMAFDADAFGSWGCPPERYAEAIDLVTSGAVTLLPFTRRVDMTEIASALDEARAGSDPRRIILTP